MRFGFYLNPVARLRSGESTGEPEPVVVADLAVAAGARVILAGWTPVSGDMTERDIRLIRDVVHVDLILVVPQDKSLVEPVVKMQPEGVVLVASGWDGRRDFRPVQLEVDTAEINSVAAVYKSAGQKVSLLIEPNPNAIKAAARHGLSGIVLDAKAFAAARTDEEAQAEHDRIADAILTAHKFGLRIAVGHGLSYHSVGAIAELAYIEEVFAGQAVTARSVINGIDRAVRDFIAEIDRNRTI